MLTEDEEIECIVGHLAYKIVYKLPGDEEGVYRGKHVVLKAKPRGDETTNMLCHVATNIGGDYAKIWQQFQHQIGFSDTDRREIEALRLDDPAIIAIQPHIYHLISNEEKEIFAYVSENFKKEAYTHMDSVDEISIWSKQDILDVLSGVAGMHARYLGREAHLPENFFKWLDIPSSKTLHEKLPLWEIALKHNCENFPTVWDKRAEDLMKKTLSNLKEVYAVIHQSPKTLVHNDFNVRNICLRPNPGKGKKRLCLYDWELVSLAPPQHDIAEFLTFVLPLDTKVDTWQYYVMQYRSYLLEELAKHNTEEANEPAQDVERALQPDVFQQVFDMSVLELLTNRFALYGLPHTFHPYSFLERVIHSAVGYVSGIKDKYEFLKN